MTPDTVVTRFMGLAMLFTLVGLVLLGYLSSLTPLKRGRRPASRSLQARGLRRITLVVPESCANGLLQGARELLISDFRQMWAIHEILGLPRVTYQS